MLDRSTQAPVRKKKKRWWLRIFLTLFVLVLAIVVTVQIVLRSAYPKTLVIAKVEKALGLNVQAQSLSTGWFGHTVLRDVTISLPLADQSFLKVPELRVEHSTLAMIALTRGVKIDSLEFDQPAMVIRQDQSGRWNVQEALELIARTTGAKSTQQRQQPTLPAVTLVDGSIHVVDRDGREADLAPVNLEGKPQSSLAWQFDAKIGDELSVSGAVNPGGAWQHIATFSVSNIKPWLRPWVKNLPDTLAAKGKWQGQIQSGTIRGQARLETLTVGNTSGSGVLNIQRDASGLRVQPDGVLINTPIPQAPQVRVTSGQITVLANQMTLSALTISAAGGDVRLSGNYSWADVAGEIEATWQGITLPQGIVNAGSAKASIKTPLPNRPEISAELHSRGKTRAGHWNAEVNLSGKGSSWQNIDWTLDAPLLEFSAIKHQFELHSLGAHLITADNKLRLVEITHPGAGVVHGTGELDFATRNWALDVSAGGVQVPNAPPAPIDLAIQASGESLGSVKVKEARFRQQDLVLAASGFYDAKLPKPVNLTIHVSQQPTIAEEASNPLMKGTLESQSTAAGTLDPLDIGLTGQLRAEGLTIRDRPVGNATLQFNGELNRDGALFKTTDLQALGGWWKLTGTWAGEDEPVKLHISAHDVSVGDVAEVIKKNRIAGTLAGDWDLTTSSLRPSQMKLSGGATIVSPSVGVLSAEKLEAAVSMEDGIVHLDSIEAHKSNGKITASASFPLLHPTQWHFEGKMTNWPNALPRKGSSMSISAQTEFDADFAQRAVVGTLDSSETLVLNDAPAGTVLLSARSQGNTIELHNISADLIGGTLTGSGAVQLDNLLQSQVLLHVENIEAQRVAEIWPQVSDLSGKYNALFTLAPTTDPRALGPLRLSLTVYSQNARFRTISVGNIDVVAFADRQDGRSRLVIDDSVLNLADGQVRVWGRRSQHAGPTTNEAGPVSTQVELRFSNLNLNQIIHAFKPNEKPTPGRVAGSFVLTGKLNEFAKLFGTGNIRLSDSDIGNVEPFTTIYNFLNLRFGQHAPEGRGYAELRLDGDQLEISNAHYRIGGAEVRMSGTIQQLTKAPDSPIHGRAIASVQPFSDWKIPFIKEAGAFFATIQSGTVGAFRISGTLANRRTTPAAFSDAANIFRELLGMQTTEEP